jgi:hypothetical protein
LSQKQQKRNAPPTDLTPAGLLAAEILADRSDVRPSIERIMGAGLSDEVAVRALGLFRDALATVGDPHRDPRSAIATARTST